MQDCPGWLGPSHSAAGLAGWLRCIRDHHSGPPVQAGEPRRWLCPASCTPSFSPEASAFPQGSSRARRLEKHTDLLHVNLMYKFIVASERLHLVYRPILQP